MSYFALIVAFSEKYDEDTGSGTLISTMIPYSIALLIGWSALLIVWYVFALPLGPGATIMMQYKYKLRFIVRLKNSLAINFFILK